MKKLKLLSLLLAILLLLQSSPLFAAAAEIPLGTEGPLDFLNPTPENKEPEFGQVCIQNGCRTIEGMVPLAGSGKKLPTAQAAFLYEINTGTVVYSYMPDTKMAPGNLTKLVNAVVALQTCRLDEKVVLTSEINRLPVGSHHAGLKRDEEVTIRDLVNCMLLFSANDAANGLAVAASGNPQSHVTRMNQWVQSIGCTSTNFTNVHGLDTSECVTTARDMAKIYLAAIQNLQIKEILGSLSYEKPATNKNEKFGFRTRNYMIDQGIIPEFMDDRVTGGMESTNMVYGVSLVVTAEAKDMNYIAVILNATRVYKENSTSVITWGNFNEMTDLLKIAFDSHKRNRILYNGQIVNQFSVEGGECNAAGQVTVDVDSVVPVNAHMDNLIMDYTVKDGMLKAPINMGDQIATLQIEYRGSVLTEAEVFAVGNVTRAGRNGVTIHSTAVKHNSGDGGFLSVIGTVCVIGLGVAAAYLAFNAYMRGRIRARRRKRRADRRRNY